MITFSHLGNYGRLSNQMFQYATLYNTAKYNGYKFGIPYRNETPTYFVNDPRGSFKYGLELHKCFNINALNIDDYKSLQDLKYSQIDFNYNPDILKIQDSTDIIGYFQSELYFKEYKNDVLKEFTFKNEIILKAMQLYYGLKTNNNNNTLVSLHVRRGDYTLLPEHHPLCTMEYYNNAIEYIKNKLTVNFTLIVFSDDISFCKEMFKDYKNIEFVNNDTYTDLCLMSMCDHHIIANSSYSWWGSFLQKSDHITIAPKIWFGKLHNNLNTRDLIPKDWIKL